MKTFVMVNKEELVVRGYYIAEEKDDVNPGRSVSDTEPICVHLELPEGLSADCVKAVLIEDVITLVGDSEKVAAKAEAAKAQQVAALKAISDKDITDAMFALFGTMNENSATRQYLTWEKMVTKPSSYVGNLFADETAVLAYATPKVAACEAYSLFCIERSAQFNADKAAILNG